MDIDTIARRLVADAERTSFHADPDPHIRLRRWLRGAAFDPEGPAPDASYDVLEMDAARYAAWRRVLDEQAPGVAPNKAQVDELRDLLAALLPSAARFPYTLHHDRVRGALSRSSLTESLMRETRGWDSAAFTAELLLRAVEQILLVDPIAFWNAYHAPESAALRVALTRLTGSYYSSDVLGRVRMLPWPPSELQFT